MSEVKINHRNILINDVNIVTMTDARVSMHQAVMVRDGTIEGIGPARQEIPGDIDVIDGAGRYVMPGLVNMHVHLGDNPDDLLLYLANGITTVRNMWGYEDFSLRQWLFGSRVFHHLRLKEQVRTGQVIGPDIYTAGLLLDGDPPFFPRFMSLNSITSRDQAERVITEQKAKGYDFLKVYSNLSEERFNDIMAIARQYDMPVAGHVPDVVSLEYAVHSGMRSIEHLYGFINPYFPERSVLTADVSRTAELVAEKGVWQCPTLVAHMRLANVKKQADFEGEEQMRYVPNRVRRGMRMLIKAADSLFRKRGLKPNHEYKDDLFRIVVSLRDAGAGLLLGTDKCVPYTVAGFSEFEEMRLLRDAGLSSYDILKAATVNAAVCLGQEAVFGTVTAGKRADLLLTRENPLENLDTVFHHAGVMKSGRYLSREQCDDMLAAIRRRSGH